nr:Oxidoreductase, N-terminal protein [Ipomoea batatas]
MEPCKLSEETKMESMATRYFFIWLMGRSKASSIPFVVSMKNSKLFSQIFHWQTQRGGEFKAEPRLSFVEGARDIVVLEAMLESGKREGAPVQVTKF